MKLIDDVGFDQSFSFIYSRRPGTPAANLPDDTAGRGEARAPGAPAGRASTHNARAHFAGDGRQRAARAGGRPSTRDASELTGRTENMRYVNFPGPRA